MRFEVALTAEADFTSTRHLLHHFEHGVLQEDLCFALWHPSSGSERRTAIVDELILPSEGDRLLHGNASFLPDYVARAIRIAREKGAGLAFMHSHPGPGWQGMSQADVEAERDALAYPAGATGLPLLGMTVGRDGYWSARFWSRHGKKMRRSWCEKVRIVGPKTYRLHFNDYALPPPPRRDILRRTFDTWGRESQDTISRLRVGIVGLGSVGCVVAEAMARIGIAHITLVDPDSVEEHNLDRLLYGTRKDIGRLKVHVAAEAIRQNATAEKMNTTPLPVPLQEITAYKAILDCDLIFSCVDRPVARDVLNYVAQAHLIPVIDGGVAIETDRRNDKFFSAHWRASIVTPYHQCLRCNGQYSSSDVVMELDGSLDDSFYVMRLPPEERNRNQNVFPFSTGIAGMQVNLMLRYLLAEDWWPLVRQQEYQFLTGEMRVINEQCHPNCSFRSRRAAGDAEAPHYLVQQTDVLQYPERRNLVVRALGRVFRRS